MPTKRDVMVPIRGRGRVRRRARGEPAAVPVEQSGAPIAATPDGERR